MLQHFPYTNPVLISIQEWCTFGRIVFKTHLIIVQRVKEKGKPLVPLLAHLESRMPSCWCSRHQP
jgi:hypothetical protein